MNAVFRQWPVVVDHATDGKVALDRISKHTYAIVLDLMLPGSNGFEIIREMKHRTRELLARTIVVTAASDSTLRMFDDAAVVRRVMRKPFDQSDFVKEVLSCGSAALSSPLEHVHHNARQE